MQFATWGLVAYKPLAYIKKCNSAGIFTCSKSTIETAEQHVKPVQS